MTMTSWSCVCEVMVMIVPAADSSQAAVRSLKDWNSYNKAPPEGQQTDQHLH